MEEPKLYTCFEATNQLGEHVYVIYSAKLSDLHDKKVGSRPVFNVEAVIDGLKSMGCGVFDSKIVLTGGIFSQDGGHVSQDGFWDYPYRLIMFDPKEKCVSHREVAPMYGEKIRPVVFELYKRLYVLSTSTYVCRRSFEVYYPQMNFWDELEDPYLTHLSGVLGNEEISGRTPYSWFVFGNCLCMSTPKDKLTYVHHARQTVKFFMPNCYQVFPFRGMATTYWQPGFSDVVVIYLTEEGVVEGRRLKIDPLRFGEPEKIFDTVPYKPDGELSSYFADFGKGAFCLTVYDNVSIHVYMFTIDRLPDEANGALNIELKRLVDHKYSYSDLAFGGNKCVGLLGCFALPSNDREKRVEEADLYRRHFPHVESGAEDEDLIPIIVECTSGLQDLWTKAMLAYDWKIQVEAGRCLRHLQYGESETLCVRCALSESGAKDEYLLPPAARKWNLEMPTDDRKKRVEEAELCSRHFSGESETLCVRCALLESGAKDEYLLPPAARKWNLEMYGLSNLFKPTDDRKKRVEEAELCSRHFSEESGEKDNNVPSRNTRPNWDVVDSDNLVHSDNVVYAT